VDLKAVLTLLEIKTQFSGRPAERWKCINGIAQMLSVTPVSVNSSFLSSKSVGHFRYIPSNSFTNRLIIS
jgi:hypothetical protein